MTAFRSDSASDDGRPVPGESALSSGDRDTSGAEAEGPSTQTSVYLVDDHPPIRDAIRRALGSTIDLRVCGHAGTLAEARRGIDERDPGVVVVDISLPDGHGLDLVQALCEQRPAAEVVVFSMHDETIYAERAIRAGAAGYLMKTAPLEELIEAIRRAEQGGIYLSEAITTTVLSSGRGGAAPRLSFAIDELSGRERQVVELLGEGESTEDIRDELGLSRKTVETYRRRARKKLDLESVRSLRQYAVQWTYGPDLTGAAEADHDRG